MRIGLRDLFWARNSNGPNGEDKYDKPIRLAKAIQADIAPSSAEAILHADDAIDEIVKEFSGGQLTLGMNDLAPAKQAVVLGQQQDADGVVYAGEGDDPPYGAIGFRALRADGKYRYIWLYKVKFAIPTENHATKGSSITFQTPQLIGSFIKREDGGWKADYVGLPTDDVAKNWFNEVREPNDADPDPGTDP